MRPIKASDLMNPEVLTVRDKMTVRELAEFLVEHEISGAPVENRSGTLVGMVSLVDVAKAATRGDRSVTAAEIMTPDIVSVRHDAEVAEVAQVLLDQHLHRLLVSDRDRMVGIVSTSDLLGLLVEE